MVLVADGRHTCSFVSRDMFAFVCSMDMKTTSINKEDIPDLFSLQKV
jgi:hypothetical protein